MVGPASFRAAGSWPDAEVDQRVFEAILVVSGERGYESARVQDVLDRARISRVSFYRRYSSKEECFARAYSAAAEALCETLLATCRSRSSWRASLREALAELLGFIAAEPMLARAALIEVRSAPEGGPTSSKRREVTQRLTAAIDAARGEPGSNRLAPALTAGFMLGAVEETVRRLLLADREREAPRLLPDLVYLIVLNYFGEEAAWQDSRDLGGGQRP